ncbi:MAG: DUF3267 domain-containing protein [Finegoldia magna]|uniref:DUF3267 domain-containing protein n=1 Tax=Finegoldia magna TaxID=1260 RepID=UPI00290D6A7E|nr:DUF3267 domain-containing protein [Finegoldia magna]MDU5526682.1 DUF3267 domain-containing protein [Finegoldia magna]
MTKDEEIRVNIFNKITEDLLKEGYISKDVSIEMFKAHLLTIILLGPLVFLILKIYERIYSPYSLAHILLDSKSLLLLGITIIVLTVVHEVLHGFTWSLFTPRGIKDISFGFILKYLSPYCTCKVPLKRWQYTLGVLMPLIVLGIIPTIIGLFAGIASITIIGALFIIGAGGDLVMIYLIMSYKPERKEILVYDNPTKIGVRFFEK